MSDHYNRLGVPPQASADDIRKAFRRQAKRCHPDAFAGWPPAEREAARLRFIQLAQAYQVLSDPERRRAYDRGRSASGGTRATPDTAEGKPRTGSDDGPRMAPGGGSAASAHRGFSGPAPGPSGSASGQSRPSAPPGPERAHTAPPGPAPDLRDILREAEQSLTRFGLDLRQPADLVVEELLDWAKALYRDLVGAVKGSPAGAAPGAGAPKAAAPGAAPPRAAAQKSQAAQAGPASRPRPTAPASSRPGASSAPPRAGAAAAPRPRPGQQAAALDELSVERELEQIKRAVRVGTEHSSAERGGTAPGGTEPSSAGRSRTAGRAPTVEDELAELKRRHGKKP